MPKYEKVVIAILAIALIYCLYSNQSEKNAVIAFVQDNVDYSEINTNERLSIKSEVETFYKFDNSELFIDAIKNSNYIKIENDIECRCLFVDVILLIREFKFLQITAFSERISLKFKISEGSIELLIADIWLVSL